MHSLQLGLSYTSFALSCVPENMTFSIMGIEYYYPTKFLLMTYLGVQCSLWHLGRSLPVLVYLAKIPEQSNCNFFGKELPRLEHHLSCIHTLSLEERRCVYARKACQTPMQPLVDFIPEIATIALSDSLSLRFEANELLILANSEEHNGTQSLLLLANATYHTFGEVEDLTNLHPNNYLDIILEARFNFSYSLSNSNSETSILHPIMTEMGSCYSYNSQVSVYNSPSYWKGNSWKILPLGAIFNGNPLEGDMFAAMMEMNSDSQVFIHSPQEVPESASRWFLLAEQHYLTIEFEALTTYSTDDTRRLSIKQRKCRFLEESNLETSPVYSYNLCRSECRMHLAFKLCGCIPHLYRNNGKYRICDVSGMHCLSKYKERLVKLRDSRGNKQKCDCYPTCNDINYIIQADTSLEWLLGTNFKYTLIKYPRSRLKRDVVFGASDLLVQLGGTVGLCLGCSILTIAEIFYFFTLRLFLFMLAKYHHE